jgi:hypothetical protein
MANQRKVTFEYRPNSIESSKENTPYKCLKVSNSLEFNPGDWYKGEVVLAHCNSSKWEVTIVAE